MSDNLSLVTGAGGHVGFNLVQLLLANGVPVRAGLRSMHKQSFFKDMNCEVVRTELMDPASLENAMKNVDVLYSVGAAFMMWAKDPENEIVRVNIEGTRNLIQAAAKAGVKKIVYVSSMVTLDSSRQPFTENSWNPLRELAYDYSKTDAEKLALELARELNLDISTVLPGGIYGPGFNEPSPSTGLIPGILTNQVPIDPDLHVLVTDARDVAKACYLAAQKGRNGERYLVVNEAPLSTGRMFDYARTRYPELNIKTPRKAPRWFLLAMAHLTQFLSKLTGKPAPLQPGTVRLYAGASHLRADISKARRELGIELIPIDNMLADTFDFAKARFL